MKKILKSFLWFSCAALLAGCENEGWDGVAPRTEVEEMTLKTTLHQELIIAPSQVRDADTQYAWYVEGEYVSSEPVLHFVSGEAGEQQVVLKTTSKGKERITNYAVSTYVSLGDELGGFTLDANNGIAGKVGYYWNKTYAADRFTTENFTFSHTGGAVTGYNYWDGWTVSSISDTTNYGAPGSSNGWIANQWGCMAESGSTPAVPYMVGYWGYYMLDWQHPVATSTFDEANYSNWVKLGNDASAHTIGDVTVAIHPWPYFGCLYGDGFARPFVKGDYFRLKIYGVTADKKFVGPQEYNMVDFRNNVNVIHKDWVTIQGSRLQQAFKRNNVKYLVFQVETTDSDPNYGPNSAVYFCVKDIQYK